MTNARNYWDGVAREWDSRRPHSLWRRHSDAVNASLLERWLPAGHGRLLLKTDLFDEAVGEGLDHCLTSRGWNWFGIDLALEAVRAAVRGRSVRGLTADVTCLPLADSCIDAIVSLSTIDHLRDAAAVERALAEMNRVLTPGGTLLVTMDNAGNPVVALRGLLPYRWIRLLGLVPYSVGLSWSIGQLCSALRRQSFRIVSVEAILHCPRAVAVRFAQCLSSSNAQRRERFLATLMRWERLARWPTRWLTGHYVAVYCVKGDGA